MGILLPKCQTRILRDLPLWVDLDPWIQLMVGILTGQPMSTCEKPRLVLSLIPVETPIKIWNVDGMHNQNSAITHFTDLQVQTGTETKTLQFLIMNLGKDEVILGYPWLMAFEPIIHWRDATLDKKCQPVVISSIQPGETQVSATMTKEEWEEMNSKGEEPYAILRKTTTASELAQNAMDKMKEPSNKWSQRNIIDTEGRLMKKNPIDSHQKGHGIM